MDELEQDILNDWNDTDDKMKEVRYNNNFEEFKKDYLWSIVYK